MSRYGGLSVKVCEYLFLHQLPDFILNVLGGAVKWMFFEKFLAFRCCWGQVALQVIAEVLSIAATSFSPYGFTLCEDLWPTSSLALHSHLNSQNFCLKEAFFGSCVPLLLS